MHAWTDTVLPVLGVLGFLIVFGGMWFGITSLLAWLSGWTRMARTYRAIYPVAGDRFTGVSGTVGSVKFNHALTVIVGSSGLDMSLGPLFSLRAPPLFIPWSAVVDVTRIGGTLGKMVAIEIRDDASRIALTGKAGERVEEAWSATRR